MTVGLTPKKPGSTAGPDRRTERLLGRALTLTLSRRERGR